MLWHINWLSKLQRLSFYCLQIFQPMLLGLRESASKVSILDDNCTKPLSILTELCDIRPQGSTVRPICILVSYTSCLWCTCRTYLSLPVDIRKKLGARCGNWTIVHSVLIPRTIHVTVTVCRRQCTSECWQYIPVYTTSRNIIVEFPPLNATRIQPYYSNKLYILYRYF